MLKRLLLSDIKLACDSPNDPSAPFWASLRGAIESKFRDFVLVILGASSLAGGANENAAFQRPGVAIYFVPLAVDIRKLGTRAALSRTDLTATGPIGYTMPRQIAGQLWLSVRGSFVREA
jgi:hypothetical protein